MRVVLYLVLLFVPSVAWAGPYTGVASFDLTSLVFTGIAVQPLQYSQDRELYFQPLQPEVAGILTNFDTHGVQEDWRPRSISSNDSSFTAQPNGVLESIANDQRLATTLTMTEAGGYGVGLTSRNFSFTALDTGLFTYQINYTLSHSGVPAFITPWTDEDFTAGSGPKGPLDFSAVVSLSAGLGSPLDPGVSSRIVLDATEGTLRAGTLTGTARFAKGETGGFGFGTSLYANQTQSVQSVPEPATWLLLGGGLLGLWAWRRRTA